MSNTLQTLLTQTLVPVPLGRVTKDRLKGAVMAETLNLKAALGEWAQKNNIRPSEFAWAMGYTPSYGWSLLRGEAEVTTEMLGRFLLAYGAQEANAMLQLAGATITESTLPKPENTAQTVPVITINAVGAAQ